MALIRKLDHWIGLLTKLLLYIGGFCLLFMMAATMADVVIRTCGGSILGVYEVSEILMVPIVFLALPFVEQYGGHAEVDLFYNRFPKPVKRITSLITNFAAGAYCGVIIVYGVEQFQKLLRTGERSSLLHIPYSLLYIVICVGAGIALLAIIMRTIKLFVPVKAAQPASAGTVGEV